MADLRYDREATELGGYGVLRQLPRMETTPAVFWSERGNSYVAVKADGGVRLYSINGIGEIRWAVEDWNKDEESNAARRYFLTL